ncbi:MAG: hypothetical protein JNL90_03150 [Planctomycetes bacterium]|nr:hypothetical protein [Planctomycetota bacterium]
MDSRSPRPPLPALGFVVVVLGLQVIAGFKLLAPPPRFTALAPLRLAPSPALWPFLDYDMYSNHWPEGRSIDRPRVVGLALDGVRHALTADALGLTYRTFRDEWMNPLRGGDRARATGIARRWRERGGAPLAEVLLENEPAIVTRGGVAAGPVRVEVRVDVRGDGRGAAEGAR